MLSRLRKKYIWIQVNIYYPVGEIYLVKFLVNVVNEFQFTDRLYVQMLELLQKHDKALEVLACELTVTENNAIKNPTTLLPTRAKEFKVRLFKDPRKENSY